MFEAPGDPYAAGFDFAQAGGRLNGNPHTIDKEKDLYTLWEKGWWYAHEGEEGEESGD